MKQLLHLLVVCVLIASCETESLVVKNSPQNLSENAALTGKLKRMSQYPTTTDNVVDGTSCFGLHLPMTVVANGQTVVINAEDDYLQVRNIFGASDTDVDSVVIQFPVRVTYVDYSEAVLETQVAFDQAASDCMDSVELSCIDFAYPIAIKSYDRKNESAQTFALQNKSSLYTFLNQSQNCITTLAYPIRLVTPDGSLAIEDNTLLENTIDAFTPVCEALLNPNPTNPDLIFGDVLTTGSWHVSYFFRETDQTDDYDPFDFTFNTNGNAAATDNATMIAGTWMRYFADGEWHVSFVFGSDDLEELQESWIVTEFSEALIKMKYESGGSGTRFFNLTRN